MQMNVYMCTGCVLTLVDMQDGDEVPEMSLEELEKFAQSLDA